MTLPAYMSDAVAEMARKSLSIRRDFAHHHLTAGQLRESTVKKFLVEHLPERFGITSGFAMSADGVFSNEADLLIVDKLNNAPFYPGSDKELWPVESIYALVEVKTRLGPSDLSDAVAKGRRFKTLNRNFCDTKLPIRLIEDSLFVIWGFGCPNPVTLKANLSTALKNVPINEQPDLVVVPQSLVAKSGKYLELVKLGQPNSEFRSQLEIQHGHDLSSLIPEPVEVFDLKADSLMAWYVWFDSWLRQAGARFTNPLAYLPADRIWGEIVQD